MITTSPPASVHLDRRRGQARDRRALGRRPARPARRPSRTATSTRLAVRVKEQGVQAVASLVARNADAIVAVSEAIAEEMRARNAARAGA